MPVCKKSSLATGALAATSAKSVFLKKSSLALAGCRRGRSPTVEKCTRRTSAKNVFLKKEFFGLGGLSPWRSPTVEKCTFLLCGRKVPKRTHPSGGEPTDSPPLGIPPLPWDGLGWTESASMRFASGAARSESLYRAFADVRPVPARTRRKGSESVFSKLSVTSFEADQCVRADGSL